MACKFIAPVTIKVPKAYEELRDPVNHLYGKKVF